MILETERLIIRPWARHDFPAYRLSPEYAKYQATDRCQDPAYIRDTIDYWIEEGVPDATATVGAWFLAVTVKDDSALIGEIGIRKGLYYCEGLPDHGERGFSIDSRHWGNGFATEAVRRVLSFGLHDLELKSICAVTVSENLQSQRVLLKSGMRADKLPRPYSYIENPNVSYFEILSHDHSTIAI